DSNLIQKIKQDKENLSSTAENYTALTRHFNKDLEYNYHDALKKLHAEKKEDIIGQVENPYEKFNYTFYNISRFKDRDFHYSVDDKIGRFHSNFTNMKGDFKEFILYNGENLVSVDISNSQPYLSTVLLSKEFYETTSTQSLNIHSLPSPHNPLPFISSHNIPTLPPPMCAFPTIDTHEDVKLFKELVRKGELYEYLEQVFKAELGLSYANRKAVKEAVFTVLFTSNYYIGQEDARPKKLFKKLFPTVYEIFAYLKKKDKKFLAYILHCIESYLILDVICKRISIEHPDLPIYTINDSIATTSGNEKIIEAIMTEELTKYIGIQPKLKFDYWVNRDTT
ncbi:hypothetical protein KA005_32405, partial [bacterium]|nr:hypothetical protein [bacterium]